MDDFNDDDQCHDDKEYDSDYDNHGDDDDGDGGDENEDDVDSECRQRHGLLQKSHALSHVIKTLIMIKEESVEDDGDLDSIDSR